MSVSNVPNDWLISLHSLHLVQFSGKEGTRMLLIHVFYKCNENSEYWSGLCYDKEPKNLEIILKLMFLHYKTIIINIIIISLKCYTKWVISLWYFHIIILFSCWFEVMGSGIACIWNSGAHGLMKESTLNSGRKPLGACFMCVLILFY